MAKTVGSCLCGAIKWEVEARPRFAINCHCSMCRKHHGAAFATFGAVARPKLHITGEPKRYRSSPDATRSFCGECGSSLFFEYDAAPKTVWVALGSADCDPNCRPEAHIFVANKAPWVELNDDLPQHAEQAPR
jgi:hypothetical protein